MRVTSVFLSSVAVLTATFGFQQLSVLAAPVASSSGLQSITLNTTVSDPVTFLREARSILNGEFIGYHGTNGANGNLYMAHGSGIPVPPSFNGADAELGPGIYVTDDITVARFFAQSSASANANPSNRNRNTAAGATQPVICLVTANNQNDWRTRIPKIWVPVNEIATSTGGSNDPAKLALQEARARAAHGTATTTVRFSALDVRDPNSTRTGNQLVITSGVQNQFTVEICVPVSQSVSQLPAQLHTTTFPQFNYQQMRTTWHIV
ncbi:hypothetical protein QCA50_006698 [Cerrena zonata]|uniref:Uncharacterized protein n=1 Tax=Cerrena zonata TaxID=2478898 RepID=A0AAW0G8R9_9APHY